MSNRSLDGGARRVDVLAEHVLAGIGREADEVQVDTPGRCGASACSASREELRLSHQRLLGDDVPDVTPFVPAVRAPRSTSRERRKRSSTSNARPSIRAVLATNRQLGSGADVATAKAQPRARTRPLAHSVSSSHSAPADPPRRGCRRGDHASIATYVRRRRRRSSSGDAASDHHGRARATSAGWRNTPRGSRRREQRRGPQHRCRQARAALNVASASGAQRRPVRCRTRRANTSSASSAPSVIRNDVMPTGLNNASRDPAARLRNRSTSAVRMPDTAMPCAPRAQRCRPRTRRASAGSTSKRCGRDSSDSNAGGRSGSRPSASRIVEANLAGNAVSMQISGTSGSRSTRPTLERRRPCAGRRRRRSARRRRGSSRCGRRACCGPDTMPDACTRCPVRGPVRGRIRRRARAFATAADSRSGSRPTMSIDVALEVRRLADVHRRRRRRVRLRRRARPVATGAEELVEHVVLVGREDQARDRQAHLARDVAGEDVAEVAGRDGELHATRRRRVVAAK